MRRIESCGLSSSAIVGLAMAVLVSLLCMAPAARAEDEALAHARGLSKAFRRTAETIMPTVVTIRSHAKAQPVKRGARGQNPFQGTPFEDFFDEETPFGPMPRQRDGVGSGVIIDKQGLILTNNHVVDGADEIVVRLADGREFKGADIKTDAQTDLAIVRIKTDGELPAARLGDSDKMEIGDWVIAVGNPFDLEQTVSAGIISGKGRSLNSERRARYLQTDAAINPGNSGGPLVNLDGEVVGINTAIASNSGGFQGVGFAVPSNVARWVSSQLIARGGVERAYLGVGIEEVTADLAARFGVARGGGVIVSQVFPDSPAAKAGLKEGDLITRFAGQAVRTPAQIQELVERAPLRSSQQLDVVRDGQSLVVKLEMQPLPKDFGVARRGASRGREPAGETTESRELGIEVAAPTAEQLRAMDQDKVAGVLITSVTEESLADRAGLQAGMLILRVGRQTVTTPAEFRAALEKESLAKGVLLLVRVNSSNRFVVLKQG